MKSKKLLRLLLSVLMIISFVLPVNASTYATSQVTLETHANELISMAINDPNSEFEPGEYLLGERLNTYHVKDSSLSTFEDTSFYPVFCNGDIVGILSVVDLGDGNQTYAFGKEFAKELSRAISQDEAYSLVVSDTQTFAVSDDGVIMIAEYEACGTTRPEVDDIKSSTNQAKRGSNETDTLSEEDYIPETYSEGEMETLISEFGKIDMVISQPEYQLKPEVRASTRAAWGRNVAKYTQTGNSCWAVSAMVIGNALKNTSYDIFEVYDATSKSPYQAGTNKNIQEAFTLFGYTAKTYYTLSQSHIYQQLRTKREPFAMLCYPIDSSQLGHTMACYMYDDSYSPYMVGVMDSLIGDTVYMKNVGSVYRRTVNGITYEWQYSVTPTALQ